MIVGHYEEKVLKFRGLVSRIAIGFILVFAGYAVCISALERNWGFLILAVTPFVCVLSGRKFPLRYMPGTDEKITIDPENKKLLLENFFFYNKSLIFGKVLDRAEFSFAQVKVHQIYARGFFFIYLSTSQGMAAFDDGMVNFEEIQKVLWDNCKRGLKISTPLYLLIAYILIMLWFVIFYK